MKKAILIMLMIIGVVVYGADAFEKGENRIDNGTFEPDKVGENPLGWHIDEYG